jgi:hypothetical protein
VRTHDILNVYSTADDVVAPVISLHEAFAKSHVPHRNLLAITKKQGSPSQLWFQVWGCSTKIMWYFWGKGGAPGCDPSRAKAFLSSLRQRALLLSCAIKHLWRRLASLFPPLSLTAED